MYMIVIFNLSFKIISNISYFTFKNIKNVFFILGKETVSGSEMTCYDGKEMESM